MKIIGLNGATRNRNGGSLTGLGAGDYYPTSGVNFNQAVNQARQTMTPAQFDEWLNVICTHFPRFCQGGATTTEPPVTATPVVETPWYENTSTLLVLGLAVALLVTWKH